MGSNIADLLLIGINYLNERDEAYVPELIKQIEIDKTLQQIKIIDYEKIIITSLFAKFILDIIINEKLDSYYLKLYYDVPFIFDIFIYIYVEYLYEKHVITSNIYEYAIYNILNGNMDEYERYLHQYFHLILFVYTRIDPKIDPEIDLIDLTKSESVE